MFEQATPAQGTQPSQQGQQQGIGGFGAVQQATDLSAVQAAESQGDAPPTGGGTGQQPTAARAAPLLSHWAEDGAQPVQRKEEQGPKADKVTEKVDELDEKQLAQAMSWAEKEGPGTDALRALQGALGIAASGAYDAETAQAVYQRQRSWQKKGRVHNAGKARPSFFSRLGLIFTRPITAATVGDAELERVKQLYPGGVTVAVYSHYDEQTVNNAEITNRARDFSQQVNAIGISGGALTIGGGAMPLRETGDIISIVQSIHRGLRDKHLAMERDQQQQQQGTGEGGEGGAQGQGGAQGRSEAEAPAYTRVKNLAIFSHGMEYGMSTNGKGNYREGLHADLGKKNPSNIKAFVQGLSGAITSDIGVQLYACNTGRDRKERNDYEEWTKHGQGDKSGAGSFADQLAKELGPDASVYGHSTAGHTTENFAAKVFGKGAGEGEGGLHMMDVMYPESFIQSELLRLFPELGDEEREARHDGLREQMWAHYKDSISKEHHRGKDEKKYPVPIGREMFLNPDNARQLLHENWTREWIDKRLKKVKAKPVKKEKADKKDAKALEQGTEQTGAGQVAPGGPGAAE